MLGCETQRKTEMICAPVSLNIRQASDTSSAIMGVLTQSELLLQFRMRRMVGVRSVIIPVLIRSNDM